LGVISRFLGLASWVFRYPNATTVVALISKILDKGWHVSGVKHSSLFRDSLSFGPTTIFIMTLSMMTFSNITAILIKT